MAASATTRRSLLSPGGAPGLAESNAFGSNENLINHARNARHRLEPRVLVATRSTRPASGTTASSTTSTSQGNFTCGSATCWAFPTPIWAAQPTGSPTCRRLPIARVWSRPIVTGGYWALGDRGYSPFQGGTNIYSFKDDSRPDPRQARYSRRHRFPRQSDECRVQKHSRIRLLARLASSATSPAAGSSARQP